jgi:hypothetical protein
MTVLFIEGFDKYGTPGYPGTSTLLVAEWTIAGGGMSISTPLSSTGQSLSMGNGQISKTLPGDFNRLVGGYRFKSNLGGAGLQKCGIFLGDSNVNQVSVYALSGSGFIGISNGLNVGQGGVPLATTTLSIKANSIHYLEWDITIGAAGAYFVWLDGVLVLSGNGNSDVSGNGTANQFMMYSNDSTCLFDDVYVFSTSGPTHNAVLLTNPRIETQYPIADSVVQFTNDATILGPIISSLIGDPGTTDIIVNNHLHLVQVTPSVNMTLNTIVVNTIGNPIENWTAVVYSDLTGDPHTLLAQSTDTMGRTDENQFDLLTPLAVIAGTPYWIGVLYHTDITVNNNGYIGINVTDNLLSGRRATLTYSSGPPSTAPLMSIAQATYSFHGLCTGAAHNWVSENRNPPPGDLSFTSSSTPGHEDLFVFPNLTTHPTAIYTAAVKAYVKLTDTGNRSADLRMKSSGTDSAGSSSGQIPSTSYEWIESFFDNDPATSAPWTESGLNTAVSGIKVAT